MWGGRGCGPTSHLGGGGQGEGAHGGALHPQLDPTEENPFVQEGFGGEGGIQRLHPILGDH